MTIFLRRYRWIMSNTRLRATSSAAD